MELPFPAYKGDGPFVFVSYSHQDSAEVFPEIAWLRAQGFNIWYDEGIEPGKQWRAELSESIKQADLFLFYVSANAVRSDHCLGEVELAVDNGRPIIAVHLEETTLPSGLDLTLSRIQALMRYSMSESSYQERLVGVVGNHLERGVAAAARLVAPGARAGRGVLIFAAVAIGVVLMVLWIMMQPQTVQTQSDEVTRFTIDFPGVHLPPFAQPGIAISRDGASIAYSSDGMLYLRRMDEFDGQPLAGTQGAMGPFFSPDGRWLGFNQNESLRKYSLETGAIADVAEAVGSAFASGWGDDDTVVFAPVGNLGIYQVDAAGGEPQQITAVDNDQIENTHMWPQLLPGGRELMYTVLGPSGGWVDARVLIQDLSSGDRQLLLEKASMARYLPSGHIVYAQANGNVMAAPFDLRSRRLVGPAIPIVSGVMLSIWGAGASFDVSETGTLVFVQGDAFQGSVVERVSRDGGVTTIGDPLSGNYIHASPAGDQLALTVRGVNNDDIFLVDLGSGERRRLTFDSAEDESPIWSADGESVAYASAWAGESRRIFIKTADGSSEARLVHVDNHHVHATSWSPDGQWILFDRLPKWDVVALNIETLETVPVAAAEDIQESDARFSPDGRWVVFNSNESGRSEIYVVSFPDGRVKYQLSSNGGLAPRWAEDGSIYYWRGEVLIQVTPEVGDSFAIGSEEPVLSESRMGRATITNFPGYDVVPGNGDVLLLLEGVEHAPRKLGVVMNWPAAFPALSRREQ